MEEDVCIHPGSILVHEGTLKWLVYANSELFCTCSPETSAFLSVLLAIPFPLLSKKTSASSLHEVASVAMQGRFWKPQSPT